MRPVVLLSVYCFLILVASLLGGWVPLLKRTTHARLHTYLSFSAGVMLGAALCHMLPKAQEQVPEHYSDWVLAGMLGLFLLERSLAFHRHEFPRPEEGSGGRSPVETPLALAPAPPDERRPVAPADVMHGLETAAFRAGPVAAATTFLGLTIHTLAGGVALASAISSEQYQVGWAGLAVFLALLLHKPADSMTIATLLLASGSKRSHVHWVNALFALAVPVGALIYVGAEAFLLAAETLWARTIAGAALGFSCGTFLSISLADLLPELHFHRHDRVLLSGALLAGVALMYASARVAH